MRLDKRYAGLWLAALFFLLLAIYSGLKASNTEAPRKVVPCVVVEETVPFQNTFDS